MLLIKTSIELIGRATARKCVELITIKWIISMLAGRRILTYLGRNSVAAVTGRGFVSSTVVAGCG